MRDYLDERFPCHSRFEKSIIEKRIHNFCNFSEFYREVADTLACVPDPVAVEIGSWQGGSGVILSSALTNRNVSHKIWMIDRFRSLPSTKKYLREIDPRISNNGSFIHLTTRNLADTGLIDNFNLLQCDSALSARLFDDASCDFVFIDANHGYRSVLSDIDAWLPKVRPGGIIAGHDLSFQGVKQAVSQRFGSSALEKPGDCWCVQIPLNRPTISVIACAMNRPERVRDALENWLSAPEINEIVLVDWSSRDPITAPKNDKLRIVRVEGEEFFSIAPALNLAASFATGDIILKMDVDYLIGSEFLKNLRFRNGYFWRGDNSKMAPEDNERHLNGCVAVSRLDFEAVGGYHEGMIGYGHDDCDLYERLESIGLIGLDIRERMGIYHVPHKRTYSTENMPHNDHKKMRADNIALAKAFPWRASRERIKWHQTDKDCFTRIK